MTLYIVGNKWNLDQLRGKGRKIKIALCENANDLFGSIDIINGCWLWKQSYENGGGSAPGYFGYLEEQNGQNFGNRWKLGRNIKTPYEYVTIINSPFKRSYWKSIGC